MFWLILQWTQTLSETECQSVDYCGSASTELTRNPFVWCSMLYLDCRSWHGCCCQAQRRSEPGCPATPGTTPGSRDGTVPRRRGKTPPSCWWARRLLWGHGTATGWDGAAPPPCFSMWPESRCSSWGCTSLPAQRGEMVRERGLSPISTQVQSRFSAHMGKLWSTGHVKRFNPAVWIWRNYVKQQVSN